VQIVRNSLAGNTSQWQKNSAETWHNIK
jgi:hypothetical protein